MIAKNLVVAFTLSAALAAPAATAILVADPCTVYQYHSCYIGVDGTDTQTLTTTAPNLYDFVGLGVLSTDPNITPPPSPTGNLSGTLNVNAGGSITLNYNPSTIGSPAFRPQDNSVLVGVSLNSTGVLNVNGGSVSAPILFAGEADGARPSTGTVTISNGGTFNATLDSSALGPLPGFPAVNIGRGLGSTGIVNVTGAGSTLNGSAGFLSVGREGSGTLNITGGGVETVGGTVFGSTVSSTGTSSILVDGAGSKLDNGTGSILVGINNATLNPADPHGTSTLNVKNGGEAVGNVTLGPGGTLRGDGTITGTVFNDGGTIMPGNSPGTIHFDGGFSETGGTIQIEIAGPSLFDEIDVTNGNATLNNALIEFIFTDGYAPQAGDSYDFLRVAQTFGITNDSPSFEVLGLQPGFEYGVSNDNGVLTLNARTDGVSIPEPATLALLGIGLAGLGFSRRRQ